MLPYWILFSLFSVGSVLQSGRARFSALRDPIFALAVIATVLLIGLRYKIGPDWEPYRQIFASTAYLRGGSLLPFGDPAYMFLNRATQLLGLGFWAVNLVCAAVFGWGLARFAERQPNPWLAFAVATPYLIIVVAMGYTRQAAAMGAMMVALVAFEDGRYVRFLLLTVLAAAFHKTAIVLLPLIVLAASRHRFAIYAAGGVVVAALFLFFIDAFLDRLFANYFESSMESSGAAIRVVMDLIPAIIYLFCSARLSENLQEQRIWRNFALAALPLPLGLVLVSSSTVVDRFALYLIPLQLFVLSRLPYAFGKTSRSRLLLILVVLLYSAAIQLVWLSFSKMAKYWIPYHFWPTYGAW